MPRQKGHNYLGKEHSPEWKEKQRGWVTGNTYNRGSVWMNDGNENKRVKEIEVYAWEVDGWVQGRMPLLRALTDEQKALFEQMTATFQQTIKALKYKFKELNDRQRYLINRLDEYRESFEPDEIETIELEIKLLDQKISSLIQAHSE